jgi:hypothetical protein
MRSTTNRAGNRARKARAGPTAKPTPRGGSAAEPQAERGTLPRVSKGRRSQFHDHVAIDQLFAVVTALTAEISVAFDRIDTLEKLLAQAGVIAADAVESFAPDETVNEARLGKREELLQRVFAVFHQPSES